MTAQSTAIFFNFHVQIKRGNRLCCGATCQQYDLLNWINGLFREAFL
jgi:hypothetical protein